MALAAYTLYRIVPTLYFHRKIFVTESIHITIQTSEIHNWKLKVYSNAYLTVEVLLQSSMDTIEEAAASIQCSDIVLKMILVLGKRS